MPVLIINAILIDKKQNQYLEIRTYTHKYYLRLEYILKICKFRFN